MKTPQDLLDTSEAAEILDLSEKRVRELAHDGKLPHRRVAQTFVFVRSDVHAFKKIKRKRGRPKSNTGNSIGTNRLTA